MNQLYPNNNLLDYVMSGCVWARLSFEECKEPELLETINSYFRYMNDDKNHKFSLLSNALTEKDLGIMIHELYSPDIYRKNLDSGGLQLVTRGMSITPQSKREIYIHQARCANSINGGRTGVPMSFDEIPLEVTGMKSSIGNSTQRTFNIDKLNETAKMTGQNLKEQIETFLELKTTAKPFFIVQGNCLDTYNKWCEIALKEIPTELYEHIGGVAISSASLGNSFKEDVIKGFALTQLPLPFENKNFHVLGIGTLMRMVPSIVFMKNGLYKDMVLSYDSTTHSANFHRGTFLNSDGYDISFPRHFDRTAYQVVYDDVCSKFNIGLSIEEYYDTCSHASKVYQTKFGSRNNLIKCNLATILSSVKNFQNHVNRMVFDQEFMDKFVHEKTNNKVANAVKLLSEVKCRADFDAWERNAGKTLKSKPVQRTTSNLSEFF